MKFQLFLSLWNMIQNQATPIHHFRIANWLENSHRNGSRNLLLTAFRASGKSTMVALYAAWQLMMRPDLRILVLAADLSLSTKMVRNIKRVIEKHPLTKALKPERLDQWANDRFTVVREKELRDPSVLAKSITTNITGSRADFIICDDVEVPQTCETAEKRKQLREALDELSFILTPGGTLLYVGTPHSWYTIYADEPRKEIGEEQPYLKGFQRLKIPVLNKSGQSAWPERFPEKEIDQMKRRSGPNKFLSQMMLEPVNIMEGRLDPSLLQIYDEEIDYLEANTQAVLSIGDKKMASCSAWWDPSFGSAQGDASVLAIVYTDEEGSYWLHRLFYMRVQGQGEDEATQQCRMVQKACKEFYVPSVSLEINGLGKFLPAILRRELGKANTRTVVKEFSSRKPKDIRILEAFDAVLAARALYVHRSVYQTPFVQELQEWRPGLSSAQDDGLDAVAGALAQEPVRLKRHYMQGIQKSWNAGQQQNAKTDFDV